MAKTLIGNIKGKDGRGIASISKTGTTGSVDTYTIKYTDGTTSTYTVNNSDSISLQRQIVPSASVESSTTASQAYTAGDYVVVNGVLRKVTAAIAKGNAISDSNSVTTTIVNELSKMVYPVGSIYMSVNPADPATIFGGTWERINGRFLVGAGSNRASGKELLNKNAGDTGGKTYVTRSDIGLKATYDEAVQYGAESGGGFGGRVIITKSGPGAESDTYDVVDDNNLPPYLAVYMWKRTA